jgi:hypothetical protein
MLCVGERDTTHQLQTLLTASHRKQQTTLGDDSDVLSIVLVCVDNGSRRIRSE